MNIFGYELLDSDIWLLGIVGALITALLGSIIYRTNASRINRKTALIQTAAKFREAIDISRIEHIREYHLLNALDSGLVPEEGERFEGEYFKHKRAVREYWVYLPWYGRFRLNKAWKKYHGGDEEHPDLWQYCNRDDGPELLKKRLEKLRRLGNTK